MKNVSIIKRYCQKYELIDRKTLNNEEGIDVIIPIFGINPLFEKNLYSFYREIPINQLIIGDAGCTDDSIEVVKKFPRVEIVDQGEYYSLGFCIAELMSLVETEWFIYLHSDVFLPKNWYNTMKKNQSKYDWFESDRRNSLILDIIPKKVIPERALSGSQMGRKKAFEEILPKIKDDYLYRNEDIIFHELIEAEGFKYGRISDTFHFHQIMNKRVVEKSGEKELTLKNVIIEEAPNKKLEIKTYRMQAKGIIKYLQPKPYLVKNVNLSIMMLQKYNAININQFKKWIKETNEIWLKYVKIRNRYSLKVRDIIQNKLRPLVEKLFNLI